MNNLKKHIEVTNLVEYFLFKSHNRSLPWHIKMMASSELEQRVPLMIGQNVELYYKG